MGEQDSHKAPISITAIPTIMAAGILLQKPIRSIMLRDRAWAARDIVEDEMETFAFVVDIVLVLALVQSTLVGEVLCGELDLVDHAGVVVGPGGSALVAGC